MRLATSISPHSASRAALSSWRDRSRSALACVRSSLARYSFSMSRYFTTLMATAMTTVETRKKR